MSYPCEAAAGEIEIEFPPFPGADSADAALREEIGVLLRRTCKVARALVDAEQAGLSLSLVDDPAQAHKYFSLSEKYAAYRDFRVDPKGIGLHGLAIPPGEVVRLTDEQIVEHPAFENFSSTANEHPPLRGWLATSVCGSRGHAYGLLQLSDKRNGREFDGGDEEKIRELAALVGETLDWLRRSAATNLAAVSSIRQAGRRGHR